MQYPKFKEMERAYGFDEVALVPGDITVNPDQTDLRFSIGTTRVPVPHPRVCHGCRRQSLKCHRVRQAGRSGGTQSRRRSDPVR